MTVQNQDNKHIYNGDGVTVLWPYTFSIGEDPGNPLSGHADWIKVILVDPAGSEIPLTSDYYVDLVNHQVKYPGYEPGTEPAPELQPPKLPVGWKIVLLRDVPLTQEMDLVTQGPYLAEDVERAFDKITFIAQQLAEKLGRVLIGPVSSVINFMLPAPVANALLGWSADGTRIENKTGIPDLFSASEVQAAIDHITDPVAAHQSSAIQHGAGTVEGTLQALQTDKLDATAQAADTAKVAGKTVDLTGIQDGQALVYDAATEEFIPGDAGAGVPGLTNYIASGLKLRAGADLNLTVEIGRASISEKDVQFHTEQILALAARMAQLVYAKMDGTVDKILAAFPAADANTICRFIVDGSATLNSTVGAYALSKVGAIAAVDAYIGQGAKNNGDYNNYYNMVDTTGLPTGPQEHIIVVITQYLASTQILFFVSLADGFNSIGVSIVSDGQIYLQYAGTSVGTSYYVTWGAPYVFTVGDDGTNRFISVNGVVIYSRATAAISPTKVCLFRSWHQTSGYSQSTINFYMIRNAVYTSAERAAMANGLLFPCRYYHDPAVNEYTDIRSILPADSIALGIVRTDADSVVEANDTDYMTGRREGATGGNRKVFLGWKYIGPTITTLLWDSPFDTRKIKLYFVWASSANGADETRAIENPAWASGSGGHPAGYSNGKIGFATRSNSAILARFNDVDKTSGYIGCYAEVIE